MSDKATKVQCYNFSIPKISSITLRAKSLFIGENNCILTVFLLLSLTFSCLSVPIRTLQIPEF